MAMLLILQAISMVVASILFAAIAWDTVVNMHQGFIPLIVKILLPCTHALLFRRAFPDDCFLIRKRVHRQAVFLEPAGRRSGCAFDYAYHASARNRKNHLSALQCLHCIAVILISQAYHRILTGTAAALLIIVFAIILPNSSSLLKFTPRPDDGTGYLGLLAAREQGMGGEITNEFSEWNIVGRIDIWKQAGTTLHVPEEIDYRLVTVDSGAATIMMADPGTANWGHGLFEESCYGLVYHAKPNPASVAVIGPGGGTDVQTALHWGAEKITGVEINSTTISAVTGPFASFLKWPLSEKVTLVHKDGRSFMKNTRETYDIIQMSGIDTLTVNATGAFNMVEESLFTVEAFMDFIKALKPDGVFAVIRFLETDVRYSTVAAEALLRLGITEPQYHIATFRQGLMAAVLISKSRFTEAQLDSLQRIADRTIPNNVYISPYEVFDFRLNAPVTIKYLPGRITNNEYIDLFDDMHAGPARRQARILKTAIATDDQPFDIIRGFLYGSIKLPLESNFKLFKLFWAGIVLLAFICIMLPVLVFGKKIAWVIFIAVGAKLFCPHRPFVHDA